MARTTPQPSEQWREVPGFPGYLVSDLGRMRGVHGYEVAKPDEGSRGYRAVRARAADGVPRTLYVHRAVLLAFVGPCPEGFVGSHKNHRKQDCRLENLLWESPRDNWRRGDERWGVLPMGEVPTARERKRARRLWRAIKYRNGKGRWRRRSRSCGSLWI